MSTYNDSKYVGPDEVTGITQDEYELLTEVMKKDEFRKLFAEYCEEISDPANKKIYEDELTQLEKERGVDVTFINPEPGFVIKTSVDGDQKCFINVAHSEKIEVPSCEHVKNVTGANGANWKLPYSLAPARRDYDKKNKKCVVYDIVFHTDTLKMAEADKRFRRIVIDTALDGVQNSFSVVMDRNNIKFPNLKYKGIAKPTVIRKRTDQPVDFEVSPIDQFFPPLPNENHNKSDPTILSENKPPTSEMIEQYTTPKYKIVQRRDVDLQECVNDIHSKMNSAIPKELVITIDLPLLRNADDTTLDVTANEIYLFSERPAKYKLKVGLPYEVAERNGFAKFDKCNKKLIITLPVVIRTKTNVAHVKNIDSLVEEIKPQKDEIFQSKSIVDNKPTIGEGKCDFLDPNTAYSLPPYTFTRITSPQEQFSQVFSIKINFNNIDPSSLEIKNGDDNDDNCEDNDNNGTKKFIHLKFYIIGSGYFPVSYAFYMRFRNDDDLDRPFKIQSKEFHQEFLEVKIQFDDKFNKSEECKQLYLIGVDEKHLTEYYLDV